VSKPAPARSNGRFTCLDVARAAGLEFHRKTGSEFIYRCPRHDDQHPSLSINPDKDIWMCGPCSGKGTAWDLLAFIGRVDPGDRQAMYKVRVQYGLTDSNGNGNQLPRNNGTGRIVATYFYEDEHGTVLYKKHRYEPKDFRQQKADGSWKLDGVRRVLYRLRELRAATDLFYVEGEKDVENLRRLKLTATTSGSSRDWHPDFADLFQPHQCVVIIPDNDDSGRNHAHQVAAALSGKVASVKFLELPGLQPAGDVSDWIAGKDPEAAAEELAKLAEAAPEWTPERATQSSFAIPPHWKRLDLADLHEWKCEPLVPIVDGIIARGNLVYVAAETQTGKTLLGFYEARKLLQVGKLFEKYNITPIDRLLYLVLEDPDRRAKDRLLDTDHEFVGPVDRERCIFLIAPGFSLSEPEMYTW